MEKVKITREQEHKIKMLKKIGKPNNHVLVTYKNFNDAYDCIKEFSFIEMSLLLNGHYEVNDPFNVGDWLFDGVYYVKIEKFSDDHVLFKGEDWDFVNNLDDCYEKVTDPWKIKLLEAGREKPEFKAGDIYITNRGTVTVIKPNSSIEHTLMVMLNQGNKIKAIHLVEDRIDL